MSHDVLKSRKEVLTFCVALALTTIVASTLNGQSDWTQYQANAKHNGYVGVKIAASSINLAWTRTPSAVGLTEFGTGAIAFNGKVFFNGYSKDSFDYTFKATSLDSISGNVSWQKNVSFALSNTLSPPSVGNGLVYFHQYGHSNDSGKEPRVWGLKISNGSTAFSTKHAGQWSSGSQVAVAESELYSAGGYFGGFDSYNAITGSVRWKANLNQQYGWIPAVDQTHAYVYLGPAGSSPGPSTGTFFAFNRVNGSLDYTILNPLDSIYNNFSGTVFLGNGTAIFGMNPTSGVKQLAMIDLASRSLIWRVSGNFSDSIAIDDGLVFANNGNTLSVLSELTGNLMGGWATPDSTQLTRNIVLTDNLIFVGTNTHTYAISRQSLSTLWSTAVSGDLTLGDGKLVISRSNKLSAYDVTVIPEPSSFFLGLTVLTVFAVAYRRLSTGRRT